MPEIEGVEKRRFAELRFLSLCFFGFAFVRAWDVIAYAQFSGAFLNVPWVGEDLMHLGKLPVFIFFVLAARKVVPLYAKKLVAGIASLLMIASVALFLCAQSFSSYFFVLVFASALLAGTGSALSILMWAELQSCFNSLKIVLYIAGAFLIGSIVGWLMLGLEGIRATIVLISLPLLSFACLKIGFMKIPEEDLPKTSWEKIRFPWKLVLVLGVYEFAFGFHQGASTFVGDSFVLGVVAASGLLFFVTYFYSHRFDFTQLYRTPFVLIICGLLLVLLPFARANFFSNFLISAGYTTMFLMLTILLCDISHRYGISAVFLCSIEQLVMFTKIAGHATIFSMENGSMLTQDSEIIVSVVLAIMVVLASMAFLSQKEYSRWGITFFGVRNAGKDDGERARIAARMVALGKERCLSPREKEVFQLLATNKTVSEIENSLCVANGTLKSHTRRIYQKLDVHSREELRELVLKEPSIE